MCGLALAGSPGSLKVSSGLAYGTLQATMSSLQAVDFSADMVFFFVDI